MARFNSVTVDPTGAGKVIEFIHQEFLANDAWDYVDHITSDGGTECRIYVCAHQVNPVGRDWFVYVANVGTPTRPVIAFAVSEFYQSGQAAMPAPGSNSIKVGPAENGSYGGGAYFDIWDPTYNKSYTNTKDILWTPSPSSGSTVADMDTVFMVTSVTGVWIWWGKRGSSNAVAFAAFSVEKFDPTSNDFILSGDLSGQTLMGTRHPKMEANVARQWTWQYYPAGNNGALWTPHLGKLNGKGDRFWKQRPVAGRIAVRPYGSSTDPDIYGGYYGLMPQMLIIDTFGGGLATDSVDSGETTLVPRLDGTLDNDTYTYMYSPGVTNPIWVSLSQS